MRSLHSMSWSIILAGAVVLSGCSKPGAAVDTSATAEEIKADVAKLVTEFNARDARAVVAHDAPDVVSMFHGVPNAVGPAADLMVTMEQIADPAAKIGVMNEIVDVASSRDMAVYRAHYSYRLTDSETKKPVTEKGNWLIGYKKQPDGSWKIAWSVVSNTAKATE